MTHPEENLPDFLIVIKEPQALRTAINACADICTEVKFHFDEKELGFLSLDPANVCMSILTLTNDAAVAGGWKVKTPFNIGLNLNDLRGILKRMRDTDVLELTNKGKKLRVGFLAEDAERYYELNNTEFAARDQRIPDLNMKANVLITSDLFTRLVHDADSVSESIALLAEHNSITVSGNSEYCTYHATTEVTLDVPTPQRAKYSIEYLKKIIEANNISRDVRVEWSKDYPLRVTYTNDMKGINMMFILAPRIDSND